MPTRPEWHKHHPAKTVHDFGEPRPGRSALPRWSSRQPGGVPSGLSGEQLRATGEARAAARLAQESWHRFSGGHHRGAALGVTRINGLPGVHDPGRYREGARALNLADPGDASQVVTVCLLAWVIAYGSGFSNSSRSAVYRGSDLASRRTSPGAPHRLAGIVGSPAVPGSTPGIAARHLVMNAGDGLFGLGQLDGHLSQARTCLPGALDILTAADWLGRGVLDHRAPPGARTGAPPPRCCYAFSRRLDLAVCLLPDLARPGQRLLGAVAWARGGRRVISGRCARRVISGRCGSWRVSGCHRPSRENRLDRQRCPCRASPCMPRRRARGRSRSAGAVSLRCSRPRRMRGPTSPARGPAPRCGPARQR